MSAGRTISVEGGGVASEWNQSRIKLRVICVICVGWQKESRARQLVFSMYGKSRYGRTVREGCEREKREIKERLGCGYGQGREGNMYDSRPRESKNSMEVGLG